MSQSKQGCFPTKEELKQIFKEKAGEDNQLSTSELIKWLGVQGFDVSIIMRDLDKDENGFLTEAEFVGEVLKTPRMQGLSDLFDEIDVDKSGSVSYAEIKKKLQSSEQGSKKLEEFDKDKLLSEFAKMDPDGDGCITKDEFVNYMNGCY